MCKVIDQLYIFHHFLIKGQWSVMTNSPETRTPKHSNFYCNILADPVQYNANKKCFHA